MQSQNTGDTINRPAASLVLVTNSTRSTMDEATRAAGLKSPHRAGRPGGLGAPEK